MVLYALEGLVDVMWQVLKMKTGKAAIGEIEIQVMAELCQRVLNGLGMPAK